MFHCTDAQTDYVDGRQYQDDDTTGSSDSGSDSEDASKEPTPKTDLLDITRVAAEPKSNKDNEASLFPVLVSQLLEAVKELKQDIAVLRSQLGIVNPLMSNSSALQYHKEKIRVFNGKLPCSSVEDLVLINSTLQDCDVSVSLVNLN